MYHGAHGQFETAAPVRTFMTYDIGGKPNVLAAYTCTPLVKIPVDQFKPGAKIKATTIAELGNRNRPLDMIAYRKGGKDFILMANSARGVMKIDAKEIDKHAASTSIESRIPDKAGVPYETLAEYANRRDPARQGRRHVGRDRRRRTRTRRPRSRPSPCPDERRA